MDYSELKPGIYLQQGEAIKQLTGRGTVMSDWAEFGSWLTSSGGLDVEKLAESVTWVFTALNKRKQQMLEIPYDWMSGKNEQEVAPFGMKDRELFQQVDMSLQLYATAYLLKQKKNGRMIGVRWLDPNTIEPDYDTADVIDGIKRYERMTKNGRKEYIDGGDIIRFVIPGMREMKPGIPAAAATRLAASVIHGITQTADTFYRNNGLPISIVVVGAGTATSESGRLETFFKRLMNRGSGTNENRVVAVSGDVDIKQISFAPKDLDQSPLNDNQVESILAAHDVPKSVVLSDAANYATDIAATRRFVSAVGSRLDYIAEVFNNDADFMAGGFTLDVHVNDHYAMKEDEAQRSQAFLNYINGGVTVEEAYFLVGINPEDFPDWVQEAIHRNEAPPEPFVIPPTEPQMMPEPSMNGESRDQEVRQFKNWLKKRDNPDLEQFEAYHLTDEEKAAIAWQVNSTTTTSTAGWDDVSLALAEFKQYALENQPDIAALFEKQVDNG